MSLKEDYDRIVSSMPNRHGLGVINNIMEGFGLEAAMVCGDQAAYVAAALEQHGYNAVVVNGRDGAFTHSWVEVGGIELDPWARGGYDTNNRGRYTIDSTWDIQRGDAQYILEQFWNQTSIEQSQDYEIASLIPDEVQAVMSQQVTEASMDATNTSIDSREADLSQGRMA